MRKLKRKWLHKRICKKILPDKIINRRKKGFAVNVVDDWFRSSSKSDLNNLFYDNNSLLYEYLKPVKIQKMIVEHKNGLKDHHKILFSLVVFEKWLRNYY